MLASAFKPFRLSLLGSRSFFTFVDTASVGVRQSFGKAGGIFTPGVTTDPGFRIYLPIFQTISHVSTRQAENTFSVEVKTKDNVFARLAISVQWRIEPSNVERAFFSLTKPLRPNSILRGKRGALPSAHHNP